MKKSRQSKVRIRKAKKSEYEAIKDLIALYPKNLSQDYIPSYGKFFVAIARSSHGEEIIGCCALDAYSKRIAEVRSLAIRPSLHRHGIGTHLVNACVAEARRRKIYEIFAITGKEKLFLRLGFSVFHQEKTAVFRVLKR